MEEKINEQKELLKKGNPVINISRACRINDGIIALEPQEYAEISKPSPSIFSDSTVTFFIPASGSGSRMFGFLHEFLGENVSENAFENAENFVNNLPKFAFHNKLPYDLKQELKNGTFNFEGLIRYILEKDGLGFAFLPKGLIPFHRYQNFIVTPFQEHLMQGEKIANGKSNFHFTINAEFEKEIVSNIKILEAISGMNFNVTFSEQSEETNSIAFKKNDLEPLIQNENVVTRPAGHGALINNLNSIESDIIFIRNIDNIQHQNKAENSILTRKALAYKLKQFQNLVFELLTAIETNKDFHALAIELNQRFDLKMDDSKIKDADYLLHYFNRPIRVCGMVLNRGQAGGGPFWVKDNEGNERRQIIEKSQISNKTEQVKLLMHSTHFNPVEIVCGVKDFKGKKFNLLNFTDESQYFVVEKIHHGTPVTYIELPGLWNGGMAGWLTLFVEINHTCFSPVKNVLDLLQDLHTEH